MYLFLKFFLLEKKLQKEYEYYENGNIKYYGYMNKGLRDGEGDSYFKNGTLEYNGNWKNGKRDGEGVSYYENGKIEYNGTRHNGIRDGEGVSYYKNGEIEYNGTFSNDLFNGKGIYYHKRDKFSYDFVYEGDFTNNLKNSFGILIIDEILCIYIGEFLNDFIQGYGKMYFNVTLVKEGNSIRDPLNERGVSYNNGQMKTIVNKGNFDGYAYFTNEEGKLISKETLSRGRRNGEIILYQKKW